VQGFHSLILFDQIPENNAGDLSRGRPPLVALQLLLHAWRNLQPHRALMLGQHVLHAGDESCIERFDAQHTKRAAQHDADRQRVMHRPQITFR